MGEDETRDLEAEEDDLEDTRIERFQ